MKQLTEEIITLEEVQTLPLSHRHPSWQKPIQFRIFYSIYFCLAEDYGIKIHIILLGHKTLVSYLYLICL